MTVTEFADLLSMERRRIMHLVKTGVIPTVKLGAGRTSKRYVSLADLSRTDPAIWAAVVFKAENQPDSFAYPDDDFRAVG